MLFTGALEVNMSIYSTKQIHQIMQLKNFTMSIQKQQKHKIFQVEKQTIQWYWKYFTSDKNPTETQNLNA